MAKKQESKDLESFLAQLKTAGWFRKINDGYQIGIPDILGCFEGRMTGLEAKSINEVPEDGNVPPRGSHTFSAKQINELAQIHDSGGLALGIVFCGDIAAFVIPAMICKKTGQMNWHMSPKIYRLGRTWDLTPILDMAREKKWKV